MARTRQSRRRRSQPTKQERLVLFTDAKSPLKNAPQLVKSMFVRNTQLHDVELQDFKNLFKENPTQINRCCHRITQDDNEQLGYYCYTCSEKQDMQVTLCAKCFDAQMHQGHNYDEQYPDDQLCNCGKRSLMKVEAFCKNHKQGKIQVEIPQQKKQEFIQFFEHMWLIYFFLRDKNHGTLSNKLLQKLTQVLQKLTLNSVYYIRMTMQMMTKKIKVQEEEITILQKILQYQYAQYVIQNMLGDQQFKFIFIKTLIEYKESSGSGVYYIDHLEDQLMGDNVMLEELGEQGIYAYNRISDYLSYAKNNEKGKVLLSKLIEHKCKQNKNSRQFLQFIVDNLTQHNTVIVQEKVTKFILQKAFKYLAGEDQQEQNPQQEDNEEEDKQNQENQDEQNKENENQNENGQQPMEQQNNQEGEQGSQENQQQQEEESSNSQQENQQGEGTESSGRNDYFMTKVIRFISSKLMNIIGQSQIDINKIDTLLKDKEITEDNLNNYLKYAYKNVPELLQNEKEFIVVLILICSKENKQQEINKFWNAFFQEKEMLQALDQIYEVLSIIGKIPILLHSINKANSNSKNKVQLPEEAVEEWLKSYLFENKETEQRKLVDMKGQNLLGFKNAGKIVKKLCKYNEQAGSFLYTAREQYPNDLLKFSQRRYRNEFDMLYGLKINIQTNISVTNSLQKQFLKTLFQSNSFFSLFKNKWAKELQRVQKDEDQQENWKNKRVGYIYILILLSSYKLSNSQNQQIKQELQLIQRDKDYRFKFQYMAENDQINALLCLQKKVEQPQQMLEQDNKGGNSQNFKKKREEKKNKLMNKFKKNNENMIENLLTKSKSLCIGDEDEICLYCHERQKQQRPFFYLGFINKGKTASASIYPTENKVKTLVYTCFHIVHVDCFIKIQKSQSQFDCPLCAKRMNCLLPMKSIQNNEEAKQIFINSIIAVLVNQYQTYTFGSIFHLLFCHLVESKGMNSLVSLKRYQQNRYMKNKIDKYVMTLVMKIYHSAEQKEKNKYIKDIESLQEKIKEVPNQLLKMVQQILLKTYYSKIILGKSEVDLQMLKTLQTKLVGEEFQILKNHLSEVQESLIELPQTMQCEKTSISLNMIELPSTTEKLTEITTKNQCVKCKKKSKEYVCLLCRQVICSNCRYEQEHVNFHNNNFLIFQINRARLYNVNDGSWRSNEIYFNDFRQPYDYLSDQEKKKEVCELDREKLQKILSDFLDN